jgi:hypothetical protein
MNIQIYNNTCLCVIIAGFGDKSIITPFENKSSIKYKNVEISLGQPITVDNNLLQDLSFLDGLIESVKYQHQLEIDSLKLKMVSTRAEDYSEEYNNDLNDLKLRIQIVAKRLSECDLQFEDERYGNLLHELGKLKKQLGSYKNEYTDEARRKNSSIKYEIRQVETLRDNRLRLLDLDELKKCYGVVD